MKAATAHDLTRVRPRVDTVLAIVAVALAVVGFVAFVVRPGFPAPVRDVSDWLSGARSPRSGWDRFYLAHATIALVRPMILVLLLASRTGRSLLHRATSWMTGGVVGAALAPVNVLVALDVVTLPIAWWGRRSIQPAGTWFTEWVVAHAQTWALVGLFAAGLVLAMRRWPTTWHWRAAMAGVALAALVPLAADLDPLADEMVALPEGPVRSAVEAGAVTAGAEDVPIHVGSGVTASENGAYVTGLGPSVRIVLSTELLSFPPQQVAFVAMHEFAHREHLDVHRKVLGTAAGLVSGLWILRRVLSSAWGRDHTQEAVAPDVRRMVIALAVAVVVSAVAAPISNLATRQSEAAADWRALELTGDPGSAIALQQWLLDRDAVDAQPPSWYLNWLATHPASAFRIGMAVRYAELNGVPLTP